jgi:hypothetical protein
MACSTKRQAHFNLSFECTIWADAGSGTDRGGVCRSATSPPSANREPGVILGLVTERRKRDNCLSDSVAPRTLVLRGLDATVPGSSRRSLGRRIVATLRSRSAGTSSTPRSFARSASPRLAAASHLSPTTRRRHSARHRWWSARRRARLFRMRLLEDPNGLSLCLDCGENICNQIRRRIIETLLAAGEDPTGRQCASPPSMGRKASVTMANPSSWSLPLTLKASPFDSESKPTP